MCNQSIKKEYFLKIVPKQPSSNKGSGQAPLIERLLIH